MERLSFDQAFGQVKSLIHQVLSTAPFVVREYTAHLTLSQGKFIRAHTLLACAMGEDNMVRADAVSLAASIELLHLASLVHDDVIDDAGTRRGVITLQKKYGKRTAVICGDYLLCAALKTAAADKQPSDYPAVDVTAYMSRLCLGELQQHVNNGNLHLSMTRYLKIIAGKTAALFEASSFGGGVLCEKDERLLGRYRRFGHYLGMIFQLTDDCNDFEISESLAQKPVQSDFEQGVITLPLIYTLRQEDGLADRLSKGLSREEMNRSVYRAGGLSFTHMVSGRYYHKALAVLDTLPMTDYKRQRLTAILDKAYHGVQRRQEASV